MSRKEKIETIEPKASFLERSIKLLNSYQIDGEKRRDHNHKLPMSDMKDGLSCQILQTLKA